ncbi:integrase [Paraburkholderia caledonica]|uniref:Integrase n=2 Tax=Paraburkholderia caledonica TaxID=134536 RepID=A0AB73IMY9_9BURK|nr:integrase [Paraburkholderia caledonica]
MKYLFDPSPGRRSRRFAIDLSPSDMKLKGNRPRRIYASGRLIKDLFDFANFGEGAIRSRLYRDTKGQASPNVFLNRFGEPWSEKGLCNAYRKLWCPASATQPSLDFKVTSHMLRHTFATLELYAESQTRNLGFALAWVRDRLGHASIATTTVYVHCLDMLGEQLLIQDEREIDALLIAEKSDETKGLHARSGARVRSYRRSHGSLCCMGKNRSGLPSLATSRDNRNTRPAR